MSRTDRHKPVKFSHPHLFDEKKSKQASLEDCVPIIIGSNYSYTRGTRSTRVFMEQAIIAAKANESHKYGQLESVGSVELDLRFLTGADEVTRAKHRNDIIFYGRVDNYRQPTQTELTRGYKYALHFNSRKEAIEYRTLGITVNDFTDESEYSRAVFLSFRTAAIGGKTHPETDPSLNRGAIPAYIPFQLHGEDHALIDTNETVTDENYNVKCHYLIVKAPLDLPVVDTQYNDWEASDWIDSTKHHSRFQYNEPSEAEFSRRSTKHDLRDTVKLVNAGEDPLDID